MREVKITCDYCTRNITMAERGAHYTITLDSYERPGVHPMMHTYLPFDGKLHFCDMKCLRNWIDKGRRQKFAGDGMSVPLSAVQTDEDGNLVIGGVFTMSSNKRVPGKDVVSGDLEHVIAIGDFEVDDPDGKYRQTTVGDTHTFELKEDNNE